MNRYVVIREAGGSERLVPESAVPTEAALHEVLMRHPALIPAADLGFGRVVTVGFEASLASGSADLVLLDEGGKLCIVEVKKAGNPDTRRVIAQLLDYAAALWGLTVDDFDRRVLRGKLGDGDPRSLYEFVLEELVSDADDPEEAAERTLEGLGETLRTGDFALVLAAPAIPAGVERVIEYLNTRGFSVFGLEVSYFTGDVDAFVPRVVVRPSLGSRIAGQDQHPVKPPVDAETYINSLPEAVQEPVRAFCADMETAGGELQWMGYGPRVRVSGAKGPRVVVNLDADFLWMVVGAPSGLPTEPGEVAGGQLGKIPGALVGEEYGRLRWSAASGSEITAALAVAREFVQALLGGAPASDGATLSTAPAVSPR
jgi:hypothetical protein